MFHLNVDAIEGSKHQPVVVHFMRDASEADDPLARFLDAEIAKLGGAAKLYTTSDRDVLRIMNLRCMPMAVVWFHGWSYDEVYFKDGEDAIRAFVIRILPGAERKAEELGKAKPSRPTAPPPTRPQTAPPKGTAPRPAPPPSSTPPTAIQPDYIAQDDSRIQLMGGHQWPVAAGSRVIDRPTFQQVVQPDGVWYTFTPDWFLSFEHPNRLEMCWYSSPHQPAIFWEKKTYYTGGSSGGVVPPSGMSKAEAHPYLVRFLQAVRDPTIAALPLDTDEIAHDIAEILGEPDRSQAIPYKAFVQVYERLAFTHARQNIVLEPGQYEIRVRSWRANTGKADQVEFYGLGNLPKYEDAMHEDLWEFFQSERKLAVTTVLKQNP